MDKDYSTYPYCSGPTMYEEDKDCCNRIGEYWVNFTPVGHQLKCERCAMHYLKPEPLTFEDKVYAQITKKSSG